MLAASKKLISNIELDFRRRVLITAAKNITVVISRTNTISGRQVRSALQTHELPFSMWSGNKGCSF